jgi:hypothetical protein
MNPETVEKHLSGIEERQYISAGLLSHRDQSRYFVMAATGTQSRPAFRAACKNGAFRVLTIADRQLTGWIRRPRVNAERPGTCVVG